MTKHPNASWTLWFLHGLYFALHSGQEHRQLRRSPCQIEVAKRPGECRKLIDGVDLAVRGMYVHQPCLLCNVMQCCTRSAIELQIFAF